VQLVNPDRQIDAVCLLMVSWLSRTTPRFVAVDTMLTVDEKNGSCTTVSLSNCCRVPSHITRVLLAFSLRPFHSVYLYDQWAGWTHLHVYIVYFVWSVPGLASHFCKDYPPTHRGLVIPADIGMYIYIHTYTNHPLIVRINTIRPATLCTGVFCISPVSQAGFEPVRINRVVQSK